MCIANIDDNHKLIILNIFRIMNNLDSYTITITFSEPINCEDNDCYKAFQFSLGNYYLNADFEIKNLEISYSHY